MEYWPMVPISRPTTMRRIFCVSMDVISADTRKFFQDDKPLLLGTTPSSLRYVRRINQIWRMCARASEATRTSSKLPQWTHGRDINGANLTANKESACAVVSSAHNSTKTAHDLQIHPLGLPPYKLRVLEGMSHLPIEIARAQRPHWLITMQTLSIDCAVITEKVSTQLVSNNELHDHTYENSLISIKEN
ncbi:hypothetical protein Tco_0183954 [Tanacetum coccineum]